MKTEEAFRNRASSHNSVVPPVRSSLPTQSLIITEIHFKISPELEIVSPSLNIPQYLVPSLESTHQHELPPALLNNAPVRRDFHSTAPESGGSNVQDDAGAANTGRWGGFYGLPDVRNLCPPLFPSFDVISQIFSESLPYHFMETPHLDALLWDSGYNALPFDQFWLAPVPTPTVTLSVPERNEVPLSTENGPVHESPSIPSTPGSPGSNLWHNETFGPASPSTSSYATSTSASASSGLISAGPKSATATPWTPPGYVPEENLSSDCLPGSCAHLDATTQCVTVDDAPFLFKIPKISVTSPAMRNASEKRRKAERLFLCPFTECGHSFTRNGNLKGGRPLVGALD